MTDTIESLTAERDALKSRVAELEAEPRIKPLLWEENGSNGSHWAPFEIWGGFSAYYEIDEIRPGYSEVSFGISCHEFGGTVVYFCPSSQAKAAAQADYERWIIAALASEKEV